MLGVAVLSHSSVASSNLATHIVCQCQLPLQLLVGTKGDNGVQSLVYVCRTTTLAMSGHEGYYGHEGMPMGVGMGMSPVGMGMGYERVFPCVRLRGLPFHVSEDEIRLFLVGGGAAPLADSVLDSGQILRRFWVAVACGAC